MLRVVLALCLLVLSTSATDPVVDEALRLYGDAVRAGNLEDVVQELVAASADESTAPDERARSLALAMHLAWKHGEIREARKHADTLVELSPLEQHLWWSAVLEESDGRVQRARKVYERLVEEFPGTSWADDSRLRLALLPERASKRDEPSPLRFWAEERTPAEKNRAAVVLGLMGRPFEALNVLHVEGDEKERFRWEVRATEWALDADDQEAARSHAWRAYDLATLSRNRRYALTLLVEAHRAANTTDELAWELEQRDELDDEARKVWIGLLRETGQVDRALELAGAGAEDGFSVELRRELLEMCREAGREDELVARYRRWMEAEPAVLEWREGLTRHYLERGLEAEARALWTEAPVALANLGQLLVACDVTSGLGLDDLALAFSERAIQLGTQASIAGGLLFQVSLFERRGDLPKAIDALARLEAHVDVASPARMDVAEAWERLGQLERAVETLEGVKAALGGELAEDLEMRLAWLLSEIDREEDALVLWRELWGGIDSLSRRRYAEDRLMTVAARLGTLADVAVELEKKLYAGEANERDTGLLIRIYTKANDPVSAAEVIDEFLGDGDGARAIKALEEKARIYLSCTDYYHYEQVVRELIERDPEGELDYLRQLAMSQLERGKPEETRDVLARLKTIEGERTGSEFEAGVLALAGLAEEAIEIYRLGLVDHPERIESYLLLGKLLKETGQVARGVGTFQYLIENAAKDDLFTIAIDGLLNLEADQAVMQWARRRTLERIATRDDKLYLYQLAADLAEELGDEGEQLRALEAALPAAREQRAALLRELMDRTANSGRGSYYMVVNGQFVERKRENPKLADHLRYGRRLVGLGELIPPQVYLDLGGAFLAADDVRAATKTFSLLTRLPDARQFERDVAAALEKAGYTAAALQAYERVLLASVGDVSLLSKVGALHEQLGDDRTASQQYLRGMRLLLARKPLSSDEAEDIAPKSRWQWGGNRNVGDFDQHGGDLYNGWLVTTTPAAAEAYWAAELATLEEEFLEIEAGLNGRADDRALDLLRAPRSFARLDWLRNSAVAFGRIEAADRADALALAAFPGTDGLLERAVKARVRRGYVASARKLIEGADVESSERTKALLLAGGEPDAGAGPGALPAEEVAGLLLPLWAADRVVELETLLARIDLNTVRGEDLYAMQAMMSSQLCLDQSSRALSLARHWVRVVLANESMQWKNSEYTKLVERCRLLLDDVRYRSFLEFLVDLVEQDFESRLDLMTIVVDEARRAQPPLLEPERVKDWIERLAKTNPYQIIQLLPLVPIDDRASALQAAWKHLQANMRQYVLYELASAESGELPAEVVEVLTAFFVEHYSGPDGNEVHSYRLRSFLTADRDPALVERVLDVLAEYRPDTEALPYFRARWLAESERWEEVAELYPELFDGWLEDETIADYEARRIRDWLVELAWEQERELVEERFTAWEAQRQRSAATRLRWTQWLAQVHELDDARAVLDAALLEFPDDEELKQQNVMLLDREGRTNDAIEASIAMLEDASGDDLKQRLGGLVSRLLAMQHHGLAREFQRRRDALDEPQERIVALESDEPVPEKIAEATMANVKLAWDEGRTDDAVTLFRRQWRSFPSSGGSFGSVIYFGGSSLPTVPYPWPADVDADEPEATPKAKPNPGGLRAFLEWEEAADAPTEQPPARSAFEVLPSRPAGEAEVRRVLRSKSATELDRSQAIFDGLATTAVAEHGAAEAIASLVQEAASGRTGKEAATLLLTLAERHPEAVGDEFGALIDDLLRTVHPLDGPQLRRMARILVRLDRAEEADRLYRWCATLCTSDRFYYDDNAPFPAIPREELIDEISEEVEDEAARVRAVRAVLEWSRPADGSWSFDSYLVFAIDTWRDAVGTDRVLEYAPGLVEQVLDLRFGMNRNAARKLVDVLARAGRVDEAVRCVDLALCKQDPSASLLPGSRRSVYGYAGSYSNEDLRRWFPAEWDGWRSPRGWCGALALHVTRSAGEARMNELGALKLLCLIAVRQYELSDTEAADSTWEAARAIAEAQAARSCARRFVEWKSTAGLSPENQLWLADSARRLGRVSRARSIERELYETARLPVERLPDYLRATADETNPEAAFARVEERARFSRQDALIDLLIELATEFGDTAAVERWQAARDEAEEARAWWTARAEAKQSG